MTKLLISIFFPLKIGLLTVKLDTVETKCHQENTSTSIQTNLNLICLHPKSRIRYVYHKKEVVNPQQTDIVFAAWDGAKRNEGIQRLEYSYPGCCNRV